MSSLALALGGCATLGVALGGTPKQDLDALVGKPVSDVVGEWGAPTRSMALPDSTTVYTWGVVLDGRPAAQANCVKSLVVSPKGVITRWTANDACHVF